MATCARIRSVAIIVRPNAPNTNGIGAVIFVHSLRHSGSENYRFHLHASRDEGSGSPFQPRYAGLRPLEPLGFAQSRPGLCLPTLVPDHPAALRQSCNRNAKLALLGIVTIFRAHR